MSRNQPDDDYENITPQAASSPPDGAAYDEDGICDDISEAAGVGRPPRPPTMRSLWLEATETAVKAARGDSGITFSAVNAGVRTILREGYTEEQILASFRAFARAVRSHKINVRDKTAWFTYYYQRDKFLHKGGGGFRDLKRDDPPATL